MPVKRTAWSCQFKCGKLLLSEESIAKLETCCLRNPARRACRTCEHDYKGDPGSYDDPGEPAYCSVDARGDKHCVINCAEWEAKRK